MYFSDVLLSSKRLLTQRWWQRFAIGSLLGISLSLCWLAYGRYMLSVTLGSIPNLSFNWNSITLPKLDLSSPTDPAAIVIDKLKLQAPIVRGVSVGDQQQYDAALLTGVALADGSAALEAKTGNSFLFGHSSRFGLNSSPYDTVFALLPKLENGDAIKVVSAGQTAEYRVTLSKNIAASDVQYMNNTQDRELTLLTCWPAGTNWRRWVVRAAKVI